MRPLTLHASALNDEEYDLYTSSLSDLVWMDDNDAQQPHDDAYYEQMKIGAREIRGWLRGRYSRLPQGSIDTILRFFSSTLSPTDILTGGQFFAALRLVVHADNGRDIERGLAFVQAHPHEPSPQKPKDSSQKLQNAAALLTPASSTRTVDCPPTTSPPSNPFSQPPKSPHTAHNPFAPRPQSESSHKVPPLPPRKPPPPVPPQPLMPPPKHASILLPPHGRTSISPTRGSSTSTSTPTHLPPPHHPPVPPKPAHVTSSLMKQSLQASKVAQSMKRAEEQLEQERVLQVLKSSAVVSGSSSLAGASISRSSIVVGTQVRTTHTRSMSPGKVILQSSSQPPPSLGSEKKSRGSVSVSSGSGEELERGRAPPLPRRRNTHTQQQPSPPVSVSSLEQVALAQTAVEPSMHKPTPPPPPIRSLTNPFPPSTVNNNNPYHQRPPDPISHRSYTASSPPQTSPSHRTMELPPPSRPPPTHPDHRKMLPSSITTTTTTPSSSPFHHSTPGSTPTTNASITPETSPTARVFRSKSLHHPSPPLSPFHAVLDPPPRRKRPESVQVLGSTGARSPLGGSVVVDAPGGFSSRPETMAMATTPTTPSPHRRQTSFSASSSTSTPAQAYSFDGVVGAGAGTESPLSLSKLAKTWQPRLEKARYKAEAGLSRRGYVRHGHSSRARSKSGSVGSGHGGADEREELWGVRDYEREEDEYEPPSVDRLSLEGGTASDDEQEKARRGMERDGLKWPVSESDGWRPL